jgi:hypothetical protein
MTVLCSHLLLSLLADKLSPQQGLGSNQTKFEFGLLSLRVRFIARGKPPFQIQYAKISVLVHFITYSWFHYVHGAGFKKQIKVSLSKILQSCHLNVTF